MRGAMGILGLVAVLAVGMFLYRSYFAGSAAVGTLGSNNPRAVADVTGVKNEMLVMAQSERTYLMLKGNYATLEQLHSEGALSIDPAQGRQGYTYSAEISPGHFTIKATYSGPATGMPALSIDEGMQITER